MCNSSLCAVFFLKSLTSLDLAEFIWDLQLLKEAAVSELQQGKSLATNMKENLVLRSESGCLLQLRFHFNVLEKQKVNKRLHPF